MKKSLIALAVLAASGAAMAQSSVTIWGVVDAAYSNYSQGGLSRTFMTTSGNASSQLGFKGTEDLGGGMSASFWLEAQMNNDSGSGSGFNGTNIGAISTTAGTAVTASGALANNTTANNGGLVFNRRSTIDLAGSFGAIRLGRDYTPSFWNHTVFDPFGTLGAGSGANITLPSTLTLAAANTNALTGARTNNGFTYLYGIAPNGGSHALGSQGVYAQVTFAPAENLSNAAAGAAGQYQGARVGYAAGALNIAGSYAESNFQTNAATKYKETNIAGSYDMGVAQLMAHWGTNDISTAAASKSSHWGIGAKIPMGSGYIPVSFNSVSINNAANSGASQFAIGYVYNLSKRSALYTTYSALSNKNGGAYTFLGGNGGGNAGLGSVAAGKDGTAFDAGFRTSF